MAKSRNLCFLCSKLNQFWVQFQILLHPFLRAHFSVWKRHHSLCTLLPLYAYRSQIKNEISVAKLKSPYQKHRPNMLKKEYPYNLVLPRRFKPEQKGHRHHGQATPRRNSRFLHHGPDPHLADLEFFVDLIFVVEIQYLLYSYGEHRWSRAGKL